MSKVKILTLLSVALFAINLFLVWFFIANSPHRMEKSRQIIIIEKLRFNDVQAINYKKLIQEHRTNIALKRTEIMALKNLLYSSLKSAGNNLEKDSLIVAIGNKQQEIEQIHYKHFKDIKNICSPEQLPLFDSLTNELATIFAPHKPKHERD